MFGVADTSTLYLINLKGAIDNIPPVDVAFSLPRSIAFTSQQVVAMPLTGQSQPFICFFHTNQRPKDTTWYQRPVILLTHKPFLEVGTKCLISSTHINKTFILDPPKLITQQNDSFTIIIYIFFSGKAILLFSTFLKALLMYYYYYFLNIRLINKTFNTKSWTEMLNCQL